MKTRHSLSVAARRLAAGLPGYRTCLSIGIGALLVGVVVSTSLNLARFDASSGNRVSISGTVHFCGKPLDRGRIRFKCQMVEPEYQCIDARAAIRAGKFSLPNHKSPEPGLFLVTISPDPEPAGFWRSGGQHVRCRADDDGVIHARMKDRIVVHIKPGRQTSMHFRLN